MTGKGVGQRGFGVVNRYQSDIAFFEIKIGYYPGRNG